MMPIRHALRILALLSSMAGLFALSGCGGDGGGSGNADTDADTDSDSDSDSDADGDSDSDTDADGDTDTHADDEFGLCQQGCSLAADCVPDDASATQDSDNWSCGDACEWLGCLSTAECEATHPEIDGIACNDTVDPPKCTLSCDDASDCVQADKPLFDDDNWSCASSFCVWTGCTSAEECQEAFPDTASVCAGYGDPPFCAPPCTEPADCVPADAADLFDAENWACTDGACEHRGCLSTEECTGSYLGPDFICVVD